MVSNAGSKSESSAVGGGQPGFRKASTPRLPTALIVSLLLLAMPFAQALAGAKEYKVKAAYLYNFVKFIDWPESALGGDITICVLGEDNFEGILEKAIAGKEVKGHGLAVANIDSGGTPGSDCHLLFVSSSESGRVGDVIGAVAGSPTVTVGEQEGFAEQGGVLNFALEGGKVKVELNMGAAEKAGVKVSGKLQQVAKVVGG